MSAENIFPLSKATGDNSLTVTELTGDRALRSRLLSLGVTPGTKICICSPPTSCGCCHIIVRNSPLILDGVAASAIICCHCTEDMAYQPGMGRHGACPGKALDRGSHGRGCRKRCFGFGGKNTDK